MADATIEELNTYSEWFDKLCQERWAAGAVEYGPTKFMENDVVRMMIEEMADTVNYLRAQAVKLMFLNNAVVDESEELGAQSFQGTGEGWDRV